MINQNYTKERYQRGFMNKCAELRVDPKAIIRKAMLMKQAQDEKPVDVKPADPPSPTPPADKKPELRPIDWKALGKNLGEGPVNAINWASQQLEAHPYRSVGAVGGLAAIISIAGARAAKRRKARKAIEEAGM